VLSPHPADAGGVTHPTQSLLAPSADHPFGTDLVGRDVLTRVLHGARTSLRIAAIVLVLAALIGVPLGIVAGYFGGWVDDVIMRVTDVFLAFPALLLALALSSVLSPSVGDATIAIAATWWPWYARLARGAATQIAGRGYIESARALGVPPLRILGRHVLPNALTPVLVQMSLDVGGIILTAAALSFLGLGAQDPTPEWGLMVSQGQSYLGTNWWFPVFPGAAIVLAALAFNLVGDGLRQALDPRRMTR
jgi:peptide/nickel transport system permease protein